jgi:lipoprotein-releasing system permease protein
MYKLLLSWRYLRSRWIALASVISVTLGVMTMIVVNSVMSGFSHEMQKRLQGVYAHLMVEARNLTGLDDAEWHKDQIRKIAGDQIDEMSATVAVPAMLSYQIRGQYYNRQINLVGVEEDSVGKVSDFSKYLQHPKNREQMSFDLQNGGYDVADHLSPDAKPRQGMEMAGWSWRKFRVQREKELEELRRQSLPPQTSTNEQAANVQATGDSTIIDSKVDDSKNAFSKRPLGPVVNDEEDKKTAEAPPSPPTDPFKQGRPEEKERVFDDSKEQYTGMVPGIALVSFRSHDGVDHLMTLPGDDVKITFPTAGTPPKAVSDTFTIVDIYESKMSEFDSSVVFVPMRRLQEMRGMIDPTTGIGKFNSIQIKLKNEAEAVAVRDKLQKAFPAEMYGVYTWRDKQSTILDAVETETAVLNLLLFMIIAVAGFGILAIFFMIVVEKTKDIGILKSLGASAHGIMMIFLGYGLSLGIVGCGAGLVLGLLFVHNINHIRALLEWISGKPVFDPAVYYFQQIPTIVQPLTVTWIVLGALAIAVLASVLPARRAARLHPVEALRYE